MKSLQSIRALYGVAAAYDGLLGLAFIVAAPQIYAWVGITPPNHWGYIHFAAGMLVIFGTCSSRSRAGRWRTATWCRTASC